MKKIYTRIVVIFTYLAIIACIFDNKIFSASYSFNFVGPTTANIGDTLTFTITANGLTGKVKLSGTNAVLSDSQKWVEKNSVSITAKITGFPASITATPQDLTDNDYNIVSISPKTVTVNEIIKEQPTTPTEQNQGQQNHGTTNQSTTNQGSQSQSQSTQTTTPPPTTNYSNKSSNQSSSSSKPSQTTTSSTTGKQSASDESKPKINGEIKENATSSNNYLKALNVNVGTIAPNFNREILEYTVDDVEEDEIEITAEAEDERATISGTGTIALINGENIINISVTAQNLSVRNYKILVNKKQELTESDLRLNTLVINKINEKGEFFDLDIGFDKEIFNYSIEVEDDITDLDIVPSVEKEGIIVEILGDKNLIEGENEISIILTNQYESLQKTIYNLNVIKAQKPVIETYTVPIKKNSILVFIIGIFVISLATGVIIQRIKRKR